MTYIKQLKTDRLILRQWQDKDLPLFADINADPLVMKYYPEVLSRHMSNGMAYRLKELIAEKSWGFWAVELIKENEFIGFVGLHEPDYDLPVTPCVEIGWRLDSNYWGNGYATEAASACLKFAFEELYLNEVYSFTSVSNTNSRKVMERINMTNMKHNFEHPIIPEGHPLRLHVLYKITLNQWKNIKHVETT